MIGLSITAAAVREAIAGVRCEGTCLLKQWAKGMFLLWKSQVELSNGIILYKYYNTTTNFCQRSNSQIILNTIHIFMINLYSHNKMKSYRTYPLRNSFAGGM